jgi:hypothetical protein
MLHTGFCHMGMDHAVLYNQRTGNKAARIGMHAVQDSKPTF